MCENIVKLFALHSKFILAVRKWMSRVLVSVGEKERRNFKFYDTASVCKSQKCVQVIITMSYVDGRRQFSAKQIFHQKHDV